MDEGQSATGPQVDDDQERTPERVRREIEQTRAELGDTVAALAHKTDVKGQVKEAAGDAKENLSGRISEVKENLTERKDDFGAAAREAAPESALDTRRKLGKLVRSNPVAVAAVLAFALGVLVGRRRS